LPADRSLEAEAEQMSLALAEEAIDVNVVTNDLAGARQLTVERDNCVEQPIDGQAARLKIDAEVAGQEQVGLSRLDGDARRDSSTVEIPAGRKDIVFRHDAPRGHRARRALDGQDAIDEHERLVGQSNARRKRVDFREVRPEDTRDGTDSEFATLFADKRCR